MLLVGSQALALYTDINRIPHDHDIWMTESEYQEFLVEFQYSVKKIKQTPHCHLFETTDGEIVEIKTESQFTQSDKIIFESSRDLAYCILGACFVPSIQAIYDMKEATAQCIDEPKHDYDAQLIVSEFDVDLGTDLFRLRLHETRKRLEASRKVKYDFFHKYHIPEYIYHDQLHDIIADLLGIKIPTYLRITNADTDIAEDLFNNLTHEQKISLMVEESLVLSLERWFIPQMIENGINYKLKDMFYSNNEASPTYNILKHCCITGLKGEAAYITDFARANFFEIEQKWQEAKSQIKTKKGFPPSFYNKLFELRKRYKAGEKVALT